MSTKRKRSVAVAALLLASCVASRAQSGSIVQDEHDKQVKADTERNTKYHNNADDYPKNDSSADAAIAKRIADGFRPTPKSTEEPLYQLSAKEEADYAEYQKLRAAYHAGNVDAALTYGLWRYSGKGFSVDKKEAFTAWNNIASKNARASFFAGWMLFVGEGTAIDEDRGRALMESASAAGDADATKFLAANPRRLKTIGAFPPMTARDARTLAEWAKFGPDPTDEKELKLLIDLAHGKGKAKYPSQYIHAANIYLFGIQVEADRTLIRPLLDKAAAAHPDHVDLTYMQKTSMMLAFANREQDPQAFLQAVKAYAGSVKLPYEADASDGTSLLPYLQAMAACMDHQPEAQRHFLESAVRLNQLVEPLVDLALMQLTGEGGPVVELAGHNNLLAAAPVDGYAAWLVSQFMATGQHGFAHDGAQSQQWLQQAAKAGQPDAIKELARRSTATAK